MSGRIDRPDATLAVFSNVLDSHDIIVALGRPTLLAEFCPSVSSLVTNL